jgi:DNA-binding MurR/RpiR family transcriptional regulator
VDEISPPGLFDRIRAHVGDLSPSERRVARALLAGPPTIGLESSARLAEHAGVSGPTVSRFVQRLGFDSYGDFQRALHEDIAAQVRSPVDDYGSPQHSGAAAGSAEEALASSARALGDAVAASVENLSPADVAGASELLADPNRTVVSSGGWVSQALAGYLATALREIRPRVRAIPPIASERATAIADVTKKDVAVVFDFRRYEHDTYDFAVAMRAGGARIILFTDPWLSPIAEHADAVLTARVVGPSPFDTLTPALAVVEAVVTMAAEVAGEAGRRRFERFGAVADLWLRLWPAPDDEPA